jgi:hypothetical protein
MVTVNAAKVAAFDPEIGTLISIFDGSSNADYRAVISAQPQDVVLVMRSTATRRWWPTRPAMRSRCAERRRRCA